MEEYSKEMCAASNIGIPSYYCTDTGWFCFVRQAAKELLKGKVKARDDDDNGDANDDEDDEDNFCPTADDDEENLSSRRNLNSLSQSSSSSSDSRPSKRGRTSLSTSSPFS